jgi:hypothetical protein
LNLCYNIAVPLERCAVASVTASIQNDLLDGNFGSQLGFAGSLFASGSAEKRDLL